MCDYNPCTKPSNLSLCVKRSLDDAYDMRSILHKIG